MKVVRHANATECWTLPTHLSTFTGLLPSEHCAHFQTMAYDGKASTMTEILPHAGHHTEVSRGTPLWSGACSSGGNKVKTCTFTVQGDASVTANVQSRGAREPGWSGSSSPSVVWPCPGDEDF